MVSAENFGRTSPWKTDGQCRKFWQNLPWEIDVQNRKFWQNLHLKINLWNQKLQQNLPLEPGSFRDKDWSSKEKVKLSLQQVKTPKLCQQQAVLLLKGLEGAEGQNAVVERKPSKGGGEIGRAHV